jgi:hypothetical protein
VLVLFAGAFLLGVDHEAGEVAVADALLGALREEVDVVFVVLEAVLAFQGRTALRLPLLLLLDAQLLVEAHPPLVGVQVLVVVLYPRHRLLRCHLQLPLRLH